MGRESRSQPATASPFEEAAAQLDRASAAKKCWPCGCFHDTLNAIETTIPEGECPEALASVIKTGHAKLTGRRYDCLGCEVCYPALALNALNGAMDGIDIEPCPAGEPEPREGWPPLPGDYTALRYHASVAVCTLNDAELIEPLAQSKEVGLSIIGTLHTENLGIERLITDVLANPNIRFLILPRTMSWFVTALGIPGKASFRRSIRQDALPLENGSPRRLKPAGVPAR